MSHHSHLIQQFYDALEKRDWRTMQACYHDSATFSDPVFKDLTAKQAKAMWHMLTEAAQSLVITYGDIKTTEFKGSCRWEARYHFSKTGRPVHNKISAHFTFQDGKILTHTDAFSLWRWCSMALGFPGIMLGWSPFMTGKVRQTAQKSLEKFIQTHPEYRE